MSNMFVILDAFGKNSRKCLLLANEFNLFFGWKLDVQGRNPSWKKIIQLNLSTLMIYAIFAV